MSNVDASLTDGAQIEAVRIDKLHDQYPEKVLIRKIAGSQQLREAAQQIAQRGRVPAIAANRLW